MLKPICQECKQYLFRLNAQTWETTKLECKNRAKYCSHNFTGTSFYDENKESIIKNSANCSVNVPSFDMKTNGECPKHGSDCEFKRNSWGDEDHSIEKNDNGTIAISSSLSQIEQYFIQNNIKSVKMDGDKLVIEYNSTSSQIEVPIKSNY